MSENAFVSRSAMGRPTVSSCASAQLLPYVHLAHGVRTVARPRPIRCLALRKQLAASSNALLLGAPFAPMGHILLPPHSHSPVSGSRVRSLPWACTQAAHADIGPPQSFRMLHTLASDEKGILMNWGSGKKIRGSGSWVTRSDINFKPKNFSMKSIGDGVEREWARQRREEEKRLRDQEKLRRKQEYDARKAEKERKKLEYQARQAQRLRQRLEHEARKAERERKQREYEARQAAKQQEYDARKAEKERKQREYEERKARQSWSASARDVVAAKKENWRASAGPTTQSNGANPRKTERHHVDPKYLGGSEKQDLVPLPADLHCSLHQGFDIFASTRGVPLRGSGQPVGGDQGRDRAKEAMSAYLEKSGSYPEVREAFHTMHPETRGAAKRDDDRIVGRVKDFIRKRFWG